MKKHEIKDSSCNLSFVTKVIDTLFVWLQYILPHHALSRLVRYLTQIEVKWVKNGFIRLFIKLFDIDMQIAQKSNPTEYKNFNQFFTRPLKDGARPIDMDESALVSPVDAMVSQFGKLDGENFLIQAKGHYYSVDSLLGGDASKWAETFRGGEFATLYLSPRDYHRIHMPLEGCLLETIYVPGRLFSVNKVTTQKVPSLFARNERLVTIFETDVGPMALIMVGALCVSGIETVWDGLIPRPPLSTIEHKTYNGCKNVPSFKKGTEIGRFNMGSTVILLFCPGKIAWGKSIGIDVKIKMGQLLASIK